MMRTDAVEGVNSAVDVEEGDDPVARDEHVAPVGEGSSQAPEAAERLDGSTVEATTGSGARGGAARGAAAADVAAEAPGAGKAAPAVCPPPPSVHPSVTICRRWSRPGWVAVAANGNVRNADCAAASVAPMRRRMKPA